MKQRVLALVDALDAGEPYTEFTDVQAAYPKLYQMLTCNRGSYTREFVAKLLDSSSIEAAGLVVFRHCANGVDVDESVLQNPSLRDEANRQCAAMREKLRQ